MPVNRALGEDGQHDAYACENDPGGCKGRLPYLALKCLKIGLRGVVCASLLDGLGNGLRLGTLQSGSLDVAGSLQGVKGGRSHACSIARLVFAFGYMATNRPLERSCAACTYARLGFPRMRGACYAPAPTRMRFSMKMNLLMLCACVLAATGCATITRGTTDAITVRTENCPESMECVATNKKGEWLFRPPATVRVTRNDDVLHIECSYDDLTITAEAQPESGGQIR